MEENEKLHKIRAEVEKAKQEKQQAERLLVRAENQLKYRENISRKARTHRLIVLGAVMEQYFPELKELSEVQLGQMMEHLDINELNAQYYSSRLPPHLLQQHGPRRHEPEDAAVFDGSFGDWSYHEHIYPSGTGGCPERDGSPGGTESG